MVIVDNGIFVAYTISIIKNSDFEYKKILSNTKHWH